MLPRYTMVQAVSTAGVTAASGPSADAGVSIPPPGGGAEAGGSDNPAQAAASKDKARQRRRMAREATAFRPRLHVTDATGNGGQRGTPAPLHDGCTVLGRRRIR
jgi:hypothetical protein